MPVHLSGKQINPSYKWISLGIFIVGSISNLLIPILEGYYDILIDNAFRLPAEERSPLLKKYSRKAIGFKYGASAC